MNDFTTDPCPACKPNTVCRTPSCGRLKSKQQEPFIQKKQAEPVAWMCDVLQIDATFKRELSFEVPPPDGTYYSIRGMTPLYTHPAPAVAQPPDVQQPVVIVTGTRHVICQCEKCKIAAPAVAVNEILPSLPEPALQGNAGECCGNHTTGGEYMGQSESICCGQFEEYVPDYYTAEQMREYARAAIAAAQQGKGE